MADSFYRHDEGKADWSILDMELLEYVTRVFMFGAAKYERDNWRQCHTEDDINRTYSSLFRHLIAQQKDTTSIAFDEESELPHLAHIICNAIILYSAINKRVRDRSSDS